MNTVIIRQTSKPGRDPKMFRAYGVGGRPLGATASTTGNEEYAVLRCAAKAFERYGEASDLDEIETRISLARKTLPMGQAQWEAHLQPKSPCDLTNPAHNNTWISAEMSLPDAELSVLVHAPDADEPVWLGFHDGECWRWVSAEPIPTKVTHWMAIPEPPEV